MNHLLAERKTVKRFQPPAPKLQVEKTTKCETKV